MVEYPQMNLRRVMRDGKEVLQQAWVVMADVTDVPERPIIAVEWRDVPLMEDS